MGRWLTEQEKIELRKKAHKIFKLGNYQKALNEYNWIIKVGAQDMEVYYKRGLSKVELGKFKESIYDFTTASIINPQYHQALYNRGNVWYKLDQIGNAIRDWTKASELGSEEAREVLKKNTSINQGCYAIFTHSYDASLLLSNFLDIY